MLLVTRAVERTRQSQRHGACEPAFDQARFRRLVNVRTGDQLRGILRKLDCATTAGGHLLTAVQGCEDQPLVEAANVQRARLTAGPLCGNTRQSCQRFGDRDIRQLADVFRGE